MDLSFPQYSEEGRQLILRARDVAAEALKEKVRHDGSPFIGHPDAVARIVSDEIGLPVSSNNLVLPCGASGIWVK